MSNKRNQRRRRQRIRSEVDRKPKKIGKAVAALIAAQPAERARKEADRKRGAEEREREKRIQRWRRTPKRRSREDLNPAKRRRVYGTTWWSHSHDV